MARSIKIGTRGSKLALWQANFAKQALADIGIESELHIIKTKGDQIQHLSFDKIEGKGFFTKEIESALLNKEVDLAVHSMKDLPTAKVEGLVVAGVSKRENPADWLIIKKSSFQTDNTLFLPSNAKVGTSSARRKAMLLDLCPGVSFEDIRGNVPTRLRKLKEGKLDAILLAAAGLIRLNIDLSEFEVFKCHPKEFIPAPAQGVVAYQVREDDIELRRILKNLHNPEVAECTNVERKVLNLLEGGCHMPLGVYCEKDKMGNFHAIAGFAKTWDSPIIRKRLSYNTNFNLANDLFEELQSK
jgi:hydroxymethylbilane synthase